MGLKDGFLCFLDVSVSDLVREPFAEIPGAMGTEPDEELLEAALEPERLGSVRMVSLVCSLLRGILGASPAPS